MNKDVVQRVDAFKPRRTKFERHTGTSIVHGNFPSTIVAYSNYSQTRTQLFI